MPKNCHIHGRANQVKNWTSANCFIVRGISATEEKISPKPAAIPFFSRFMRAKASRSSGGYSFVVNTVHNTATKKTAAPILKEYSTESGIPVARTPTNPRDAKRNGSAFASV